MSVMQGGRAICVTQQPVTVKMVASVRLRVMVVSVLMVLLEITVRLILLSIGGVTEHLAVSIM